MLEENKSARLEARLPPAIYSLLKEAATLQGRSLSDFVVSAARDAAEEAIARSSEISLTLAEQKRFAEALIKPAAVSPALRKAMKQRHQVLDHS